MEFKKNQEHILTIEDIGNNGEGIGHVDGYALFVVGVLPGEKVRVKLMKCKKNYAFAKLLEIVESPESVGRVEPKCPMASRCGGCTLQHLSYEKQLEYKDNKVRNCLERIGGVDTAKVEWLPILGMDGSDETPWNYRNKAQFPVQMQEDEKGQMVPACGFYAGHSHRLIPTVDCDIQHPCMKEILETVLAWAKEENVSAYDEEKHRGILRHIYIRRGYHTGEILVCLVINSKKIEPCKQDGLVQRLSKIQGMTSICVNSNTEKTNAILGKNTTCIWGQEYIEDTIGEIRYQISPQSFYQVNPVQTEKLYQAALEFANLQGNETVWDLYCGIGTISLFLAQKAGKVYGVEIVSQAIENAKKNATINHIENVEFYCGPAEVVVPELVSQGKGANPDVVVVDPPRKGCDGVLLETMEKMAPQRIVYVSCDPATLARDVKILAEKGYEVKKVQVCDQFCHSGHVETVVLLSKVNTVKG